LLLLFLHFVYGFGFCYNCRFRTSYFPFHYWVLCPIAFSLAVVSKAFSLLYTDVISFASRPVIILRLWILFLYQSDVGKIVLVTTSRYSWIEIIFFYDVGDDSRTNFQIPPLKKTL
jgi:hypothetical protein